MKKSRNNILVFLMGTIIISYTTGCSNSSNEPDVRIPNPEILIEVETPQIEGWSIDKTVDTRSDETKITKQEEKDGLDMEITTLPDFTNIQKTEAVTRWSNIDNNTVFRIIAYNCTSAADISTTNYKGYGDYKLLSNGTIEATTPLIIPTGSYTFICYSYGNANSIPAFNNNTASVTATHGQNFMTCIKPNITINNLGSKYTLSDIVFKLRCVRYRVIATAESNRMANITACSGTLTLPSNSATFSFTNDEFTRNSTAGTINLTWNNPNAMKVTSNYIYILPQTSNGITIKLNPTIGGKAFTNKSITLSSMRFNRGEVYNTTISFTTTEGYIVGGAFWANGNLVCTSGTYTNHSNTMYCSKAANAPDYFTFNNPLPNNPELITAWSDSRDPCRRVTPANTWRTPTLQDFTNLLQTGYNTEADHTTYGEVLKLPFGSFMRYTTGHPHEPYFDFIGYYLSTVYPKCLQNGGIGEYSEIEILAFPVRCIRSQ